MASNEKKMEEIPQELQGLFTEMENDVKEITYHLKKISNVRDFDFNAAFNEMRKKVEEIDALEKQKSKLMSDNDSVLRGIAKCESVLPNLEARAEKLENDIQRLEKRRREENHVTNKIRDVLDTLGIRFEVIKAENIQNSPISGSFIVKLSKVNPKSMDKWYKIFIDIKDNIITVTKTEPTDLFNESEMSTLNNGAYSDSQSPIFLRGFISQCRNILVKKFA